uniref:DUF4371 domain-containing protein n=1 Tax=Leptobrachium leishanense TaxID=445787 RepID=A0A8C5Q6N7_9ANUR
MKLSFAAPAGSAAAVSKTTAEVCTEPDSAQSSDALIEAELDSECSSEMITLQQSPSPCSATASLQDIEGCRTEAEPAVSDVLFETTNTHFSLPSTCATVEKIAFVEMHPIQPSNTECDDLPFKGSDFYFRKNVNGDLIRRSWLTCRVSNRMVDAYFCSICIAFSNSTSPFVSGCTNFRHCYQAVNKHETSKSHCDAVNTYFTIKKDRNIDTLINRAHASKKKKDILQNIEVMKHIFDIVKLLAKQGLPFRAHGTNESLYNLNNCEINHGNFLEIVLFLSSYDDPLKNHIEKCVLESERRKKLRTRRLLTKKTAGRGSLVTFLSYNTVKKVIRAIVQSMKTSIMSEIGEKRFSIQVDSTQDVGVVDQATVVVRYVKEELVKERLISVLPVKDASGRGLNELLKSSFQVLGLNYKKIAGESFDGAANMRSAYVGLRAQIAKEVSNSVYIWCYSHLLNLCISDCCDVQEAKKFLVSYIG